MQQYVLSANGLKMRYIFSLHVLEFPIFEFGFKFRFMSLFITHQQPTVSLGKAIGSNNKMPSSILQVWKVICYDCAWLSPSDESSCVGVCKASFWDAAPCCVAVLYRTHKAERLASLIMYTCK
jgi:hypothetical protein